MNCESCSQSFRELDYIDTVDFHMARRLESKRSTENGDRLLAAAGRGGWEKSRKEDRGGTYVFGVYFLARLPGVGSVKSSRRVWSTCRASVPILRETSSRSIRQYSKRLL